MGFAEKPSILLILKDTKKKKSSQSKYSMIFLPEAWLVLGAKQDLFSFDTTSTFMKIVLRWCRSANVKAALKGSRLRDKFQQPGFSIDNDPEIDFLRTLVARRQENAEAWTKVL
ncbi:hypothetical protein HPB48_016378 [Haemaphysalis longicornis]|uniref:Uncharacterized protein n=1 Tax=Haemaphysalis longicornis TaxID=44386 RepID=A0A9J6GKG8_HAELO|nr:hypothetical protein HPB48_016378 [Haemaphysalis longicornis]